MDRKLSLIDKNKYRERILTVMRCWNISPCLSPEEAKSSVRNLQTALNVLDDEPVIDISEEDAERLERLSKRLGKSKTEIVHAFMKCYEEALDIVEAAPTRALSIYGKEDI